MKKLIRKIVVKYLKKLQSECGYQLVSLGQANECEIREALGGEKNFQNNCRRYQAVINAVNVILLDTKDFDIK